MDIVFLQKSAVKSSALFLIMCRINSPYILKAAAELCILLYYSRICRYRFEINPRVKHSIDYYVCKKPSSFDKSEYNAFMNLYGLVFDFQQLPTLDNSPLISMEMAWTREAHYPSVVLDDFWEICERSALKKILSGTVSREQIYQLTHFVMFSQKFGLQSNKFNIKKVNSDILCHFFLRVVEDFEKHKDLDMTLEAVICLSILGCTNNNVTPFIITMVSGFSSKQRNHPDQVSYFRTSEHQNIRTSEHQNIRRFILHVSLYNDNVYVFYDIT